MLVKLNVSFKVDEFDYNDEMDEDSGTITAKAQPKTFYHQNLMTSKAVEVPLTPSPKKNYNYKKTTTTSFSNACTLTPYRQRINSREF
jgi:hypothetical protein